ncbi:bifunctional diguanylate cyclase/phosphodiesterase [Thiosulfativibrio zosterae]|uniref:GGDEF domain-containing protein n=1 Tax=Thiosulfativibrio zosterae TaxID=2675053 RepID=A0A6F8PKX6_9GAMM|nr:EAL domain-containing protein [Thiosulfativibrio zosterae]BBP42650.1 hypothetical protein THMIRHAT_03960 [Thiosulfativibrio zosterae]
MSDMLHKFQVDSLNERLLAGFLVVVLWLFGMASIYNNFQTHEKLYLDKQGSTQGVAWKAVELIHRTGIDAYFNTQINTPELHQLLRDAQNPNMEKMARLNLYRQLYPAYQKLTQQGISILHFHTPELRSFLRFHSPEKFGCDLSKVRPSLKVVKSSRQPVHGFEVGLLYSGYRHLYPIVDQGEYLGSVELSQPFESLRQEISRLNSEKEYALIHQKSVLIDKRLFGLGHLLQDSVFSKDWLEEDPLRILPGAASMMSVDMQQGAKKMFAVPRLQANLKNGQPFSMSVRLDGHYRVFVFTPIQDIENKNTAYLVSFANAEELDLRMQEAVWYGAGLTLMMALLTILLFQWIATKRSQEASLQFLEKINDTMREALYVVDETGRIIEINASALAFLGMEERQVIGRSALDLFLPKLSADTLADIYPSSHHALSRSRQDLESLCVLDEPFMGEYTLIQAGQKVVWVHLSSQPIVAHKKFIGKVVVFRDISVERSHKEQLRVAAAAFETQEGILITDAAGKIVRVNQAFSALTGYDAEEIIGQTPAILNSGKQDAAFYQTMWQALLTHKCWQGEIWNRRKNGELYLEWLTITAVANSSGQVTEYVAIFSDITEQKRAQDEIVKLAFYDPLTELPNRRLLGERLTHALISSERQRNYGAVIFIDLDNFKQLNDTKGHSVGDMLLLEVAKRLKASVREMDTVARLGGDEFVILLESLGTKELDAMDSVELIAYKILQAFQSPFLLDSGEHRTTPSLGVEIFQGQTLSTEQILQHADVAMYQAKQSGRNTACYFDPEMQQHIENALLLEEDLHRDQALGFQQLELYYQPQVDVFGKVQSVEALIRWQHPVRGTVSPLEFIPMIEKNGQILAVGLWVIRQACAQLLLWAQHPKTAHLTLAVNVSAKQLADPSFVDQITQILYDTGARPELLKIELTESSVVENVEQAIKTMQALRALGLELSMDDFGTGYSSLSYLKRLPLSQLKIDQAFVRDLESQADSLAIVQTIIAMAKTLKLKVVAEGVETLGQKECLAMQGCELYQGFYFSRPLTVADFELYLNVQDA